MTMLHTLSFAAVAALALSATPSFAEDAMAPASDAMAPAMGAMAPMSDADFDLCQGQAATLTFPEAMRAAMLACHGLHQGMDVMAAIDSLGMDGAMMATDAMAPADAMAPKP